jgi:heme/copper-type cytochrome/quinol oxidase subunit 2
MVGVQLASELGYGVPWLVEVLTIAIVIATGFFVYVALSTKSNHVVLGGFDKAKHELNKYHAERYWAIFVAGMLIWLYILGYPWMPPVAFSDALQHTGRVHIVKVTGGQWFWTLQDGGYSNGQSQANMKTNTTNVSAGVSSSSPGGATEIATAAASGEVKIKVGEIVKFVARSIDVNHGFAILSSSNSMDSPLMQMQVIPGFDNVFYYTFNKPGTYTIRCLEYCGWNHPYMTSLVTVVVSA